MPRSASSASNRTATKDVCAGMVHLSYMSFALHSLEQEGGQTPGKAGLCFTPGPKQTPGNAYIFCMSRAFVNEDDFVEGLPDRRISEQANLVTAQGLALIESALAEAQRAYGEAQTSRDREALAKAGRALRYWSARRATARVIPPAPDSATLQFGGTLTLRAESGGETIFRAVCE